jgi:Uma2 family endonuclease
MSQTLQHPAHFEMPELFSLDNVSWELYELLRRDTEGQNIRITYDGGRLVLMSPLPIHDKYKKLAARLIELGALEMGIPIASFGSATWKKKELLKGLEADECYYIRDEPKVRGRADIDLSKDPPPDLALEVDITHHPMDRLRIYAALGVREVWRFDGERFHFLKLDGGSYVELDRSEALPFMTPHVLMDFLNRFSGRDENSVMREYQAWLRTAGAQRGG